MKKNLMLAGIFSVHLFLSQCAYEPTPDAFKKFIRFDYEGFGHGEAVVQTKQGGYAVAGTIKNTSTLNNSLYVAQIDRLGNLKEAFVANFDEWSDQTAADMCLTKDANFAVIGTVRTTLTERSHLYLLQCDSIGRRVITPLIIDVPGGGDEAGVAIVENKIGELVLLGQMDNGTATGSDLCFVRTNKNGTTIISTPIPLAGDQFATDICDMGNNTYMILGVEYINTNNNYRLLLMLVDKDGNPVPPFPKYIEADGGFYDGGLALHSDGSVMAAAALQKTANSSQVYLTKISSNGTVKPGYPQTFDEGNVFVYDMHKALDNTGFVITGHLNGKAYLLKTDNEGKVLFKNTFGDLSDFGLGAASTTDGGVILTGVKDFSPTGSYGTLLLIKTDPSGNAQ